MIDDTNRRILRALQEMPDATVAEIGERVGLSHTPCWRRIRQMQAAGIIQGRFYRFDGGRLGYDVCVFCSVKLKQHDEETLIAFEKAALAQPEILQCYSMSGEYDYLLRIIARSVRHYEELVKLSLLHLPSVSHVHSSFALREVKNSGSLPI